MSIGTATQTMIPAKHTGFTLVEVMVALVVMAVGMLGMAGLYVEGLRSGQTSIARTTAVTLAADMADRIRANPAVPILATLPSSIMQDAAPAAPVYVAGGPGVNNNCVNGGANCNPAQLAADDWFWWNQDLQNRLPVGANATIDLAPPVLANTIATYTITIRWPESAMAGNAEYILVFQL